MGGKVDDAILAQLSAGRGCPAGSEIRRFHTCTCRSHGHDSVGLLPGGQQARDAQATLSQYADIPQGSVKLRDGTWRSSSAAARPPRVSASTYLRVGSLGCKTCHARIISLEHWISQHSHCRAGSLAVADFTP